MAKRAVSVSVIMLLIVLIAYAGYKIILKTSLSDTAIQLTQPEKVSVQEQKNQDTGSKGSQPEGPTSKVRNFSPAKTDEAPSWQGEWTRNTPYSVSSLNISEVAEKDFSFKILTSSGAHSGEYEGKAIIHGQRAISKDEEGCIFRFEKKGKSIELKQTAPCQNWGGMGVTFEGSYDFGPPKEMELSLVESVFSTTEQDAAFRKLVGKDYRLFAETFMMVSQLEDEDGFGANVYMGMITGLGGIQYGVIMYNEKYFWAVVADPKHYPAMNYYTNDSASFLKVPKTIEKQLTEEAEIIYKTK